MSISKKIKDKFKSGWSKWESSYYGGFLPTLLSHPDVKLSEKIVRLEYVSMPEESKGLFLSEVFKLHRMGIYYGAKYGKLYFNKLAYVVVEGFQGVAKVAPIYGWDNLLEDPEFKKEEIYPLFKNYKEYLECLCYGLKIEEEGEGKNSKNFSQGGTGSQEGDEKIFLNKSMEGKLSKKRESKTFTLISATDETLKKAVRYCPVDKYSLCSDEYHKIFNQVHTFKETLLKILDINFDSTSYEVRSLREGQLDTRKLVSALGGDQSIYKKTLEDQMVKPFKVVILGDLSGSMQGYNVLAQSMIIESLYSAFSELMPQEDIKVYGHAGGDTPDIIVFHDTDRNVEYNPQLCRVTTTGHMNYDGPVIETIYEDLRKKSDDNYLMVYISDGEPSGYNYGGHAAMEELKKVSQRCKRDGFLIVAIGLDSFHLDEMYHYHQTINIPSDYGKLNHDELIITCKTINAAIKDVFT